MTEDGLIKVIILGGIWGLTIASTLSQHATGLFLLFCLILALAISLMLAA